MSPLNPDLPTPPVQQRAIAAVRNTARRHERQIEVTALGIALGVLCALTGVPISVAAGIALVFLVGALVERLAMGGK